MSRLFPLAEYAEDQPLSKTVLTTHVLHRGLQSGGLIGSIIGAVRSVSARRATNATATSQTTAKSLAATSQAMPSRSFMAARIIAGAGTGSAVGIALSAVALLGRMQGREDIEWRDRSWRLQQNASQLEVDDWSVVGLLTGAVGSNFVKSATDITPWKRVMGGAGIGNVAGVAGYMVWRYGVHGGQR